jgi:ABC-type glycerol-3-phosphate transport system permease component
MQKTRDVRVTRFWQGSFGYGLLILITVVMAVPVVWMISTALRPEEFVRKYPIQWIPPDMTLENFQLALDNYRHWAAGFMNSAFVAIATAALSVLVDTLGAMLWPALNSSARSSYFWACWQPC